MRVISGIFKGHQLKSARQLDIRPATDRVKETIFNVLQTRLKLEDARVLDLFAGTGSLAIEALSRYAAFATIVDNAKSSIELIKSNIEKLKLSDKSRIIQADAFKFISKTEGKYDLIFADPPYVYEFTTSIPEKVFTNNLLNTGGFLIIEHTKKMIFENSDKYIQSIKKEFGNTVVSFFVHNIMEKK